MSRPFSRAGRIAPQIPAALLILTLAVSGVLLWARDSKGDPNRLVVSGAVEGESVRIGSKVGGRLAKLEVAEGTSVQAGDLVASFDVPELFAQREQLLAAQAEAQAGLDLLKHGPRSVDVAQARANVDSATASYKELAAGSREEDIAAARAAWQQAEVNHDLAVSDLDRARQLFAAAVIPRSQLDAAQARVDALRQAADAARQAHEKALAGPRDTQLDVAQAQVRQAQAGLDAVAAGSRPEDISAAEARVAGFDAQLAQLDIRLLEAQVRAPADGTVSILLNQPGDLIPPNNPVVELLLDGSYFVQVFVPADKLSWAQPGAAATVALDSYPGETFSGSVTYLAASGEFTPRNLQTKEKRVEEVFRCKVKLDSSAGKLRPGMVCDVTFVAPGTGI